MIALAVVLSGSVDELRPAAVPAVPRPAVCAGPRRRTPRAWVVLYVGTVVTGYGPHAGDADSPRNGLDPASVSQLHADLVFLLVGLTVGTLFALRACGAPRAAVRAAGALLAVELAQGAVGFVQYATDLPVVLVAPTCSAPRCSPPPPPGSGSPPKPPPAPHPQRIFRPYERSRRPPRRNVSLGRLTPHPDLPAVRAPRRLPRRKIRCPSSGRTSVPTTGSPEASVSTAGRHGAAERRCRYQRRLPA